MRKAFLALLLAASVSPALAQDKVVNLKVSLWVPPAHPLVPATQAWAADIEKASGGSIKVTVFPSEQLGKAFDHYDMASDGIADVTYVNPGYRSRPFPDRRRRPVAVRVQRRQEGHAGGERVVSQIRRRPR